MQNIWTLFGKRQAYILFFIHLGTRKVWVSPTTYNPDQTWVNQQARNVQMWLEDHGIQATHLIYPSGILNGSSMNLSCCFCMRHHVLSLQIIYNADKKIPVGYPQAKDHWKPQRAEKAVSGRVCKGLCRNKAASWTFFRGVVGWYTQRVSFCPRRKRFECLKQQAAYTSNRTRSLTRGIIA